MRTLLTKTVIISFLILDVVAAVTSFALPSPLIIITRDTFVPFLHSTINGKWAQQTRANNQMVRAQQCIIQYNLSIVSRLLANFHINGTRRWMRLVTYLDGVEFEVR